MRGTIMEQYTVVMHSGAGYSGKPGFVRGLEPRAVNARQAAAVERHGGVVFPGYREADEFADAEMFPEGHVGMYPNARGAFSRYMVDGLAVYVPVANVKKAVKA
jgi:hypothetical protein